MPIPLPNLDDRRWSDLFEDGRANITRYAPQWTDHNLHDPGITIIDLFAWLTEMTNYRLNRVPTRHKRKFLELLGFDLQPPAPAQTMLSFAPAPATAPFVLPAGAEFEGTDPDQNRISFRILRDTNVQPANLQSVQVQDSSGTLVDRTHDFTDGFPIEPFGSQPGPGCTLYLGFDALAVGQLLAIGLRFAGPGNDSAERERIIEEAAEEAEACTPVHTRLQCQTPPAPPEPTLPPHHSVNIVWEAMTPSGWVEVPANDNTRSFTLDGIVEVPLPGSLSTSVQGTIPTAFFYLRCRIAAGAYDAVPLVLDIAANAAPAEQSIPVTEAFAIKAGIAVAGPAPSPGDLVQLLFTSDASGVIQTLTFGSGSGPKTRVLAYTAPTAANPGSLTIDLELTGIGSGLPGQQISLRQPQIEFASLSLFTLSGTAWQQWSPRDDFDSSTRTDFHFACAPDTGIIQFGSGERGQTPPANCMILLRYRSTFAAIGNIAPSTVNHDRSSPFNNVYLKSLPAATRDQLKTITTNRAAGSGGSDLETLDDALGRAVEVLHAHERLLDLATASRTVTLDQIDGTVVRSLVSPWRGVNLLDLERLALSVPGTRVARAHGWASLDANFPCLTAPGVVTLVIAPYYPVAEPVPSEGLLECVWRYLDRRRPVATTLHITGPAYTEITATATVAIRTGAGGANVQARILSALQNFLDPLTGGPDALGWPFGRSVYRSEILRLIQDVPGVDHVDTLSMQSDSGASQCGDIPLCPTALTRSGPHSIEVI
jgi:hypothetical protein